MTSLFLALVLSVTSPDGGTSNRDNAIASERVASADSQKKHGRQAKIREEAVDAIGRWRTDPVSFVRQVFGVEPDDWQKSALEAIAANPQVGLSACKGPGKSCTLAWVVWWFMDTRFDAQVVVTSITKPNLKDNLWKELAKWYERSDHLKAAFDFHAERIMHRERPKTWWVSARSWARDADPEAQSTSLAGFHGENILMVLDEMGDYPHGVVVSAQAIFANKDVDEAKLVAAWNPTNVKGPAYRACTSDAKRWKIIYVTGDPDDPKRSPRVSIEWAQGEIDRWGRDNPWVMVNVLGQFPPQGSAALISLNDVISAQQRKPKPLAYRSDPRIWGLDPARFGDDKSCLIERQGIVALPPKTWRGLDGPELAARVIELYIEAEKRGEAPDAIFVDQGGVGASAYDHLKLSNLGSVVHGEDFGGAPRDPRFGDHRTEMWFAVKEWLKRKPSALPTDPELQDQLTTPDMQYKVRNKRTCLCLQSKDDLRDMGIPSPDKADALALTFARPVFPRSKDWQEANAASATKAITDYDPYANSNRTEDTAVTDYDPYRS